MKIGSTILNVKNHIMIYFNSIYISRSQVDDLHISNRPSIYLSRCRHTVVPARAPGTLMEHLNIPDKDTLSRLPALKWGFPRM